MTTGINNTVRANNTPAPIDCNPLYANTGSEKFRPVTTTPVRTMDEARSASVDFGRLYSPNARQVLDSWVNEPNLSQAETDSRQEVRKILIDANVYIDADRLLTVPKSLVIVNNPLVRSLPNNLNVKHGLTVDECPNFEKIGNNTHVGSYGQILRCTNFQKVGRAYTAPRGLNLTGCQKLTALPKDILDMGDKLSPTSRYKTTLNIEQTGIPSDRVADLMESMAAHPNKKLRLSFSRIPGVDTLKFKDISTATRYWVTEAGYSSQSHPVAALSTAQQEQLLPLLSRLRESASFRNIQTRQGFANQVVQSLNDIKGWTELSTATASKLDPNAQCPITQQSLNEIDQPVVIAGREQVCYNYTDLLQQWIQGGCDAYRQPFNLSDIRKVDA